MPDNKTQECITINKNNIDIISRAIEEYWSYAYHDSRTLNQINDARIRIKQMKDRKINEIKICWG